MLKGEINCQAYLRSENNRKAGCCRGRKVSRLWGILLARGRTYYLAALWSVRSRERVRSWNYALVYSAVGLSCEQLWRREPRACGKITFPIHEMSVIRNVGWLNMVLRNAIRRKERRDTTPSSPPPFSLLPFSPPRLSISKQWGRFNRMPVQFRVDRCRCWSFEISSVPVAHSDPVMMQMRKIPAYYHVTR